MFILEGSDTQFTFHITEHTKSWQINEVDLTEYDKILLEIRFTDWIEEYQWDIDIEENTEKNLHSYVRFDLFSEQSAGRSWKVKCDIWGVKDWVKKIRFNWDTIQWEVLPSVKIPQWIVNG